MVFSLLAGGFGSRAWTLATAAQPHSGSIPTSGPTASAMGGPEAGDIGADMAVVRAAPAGGRHGRGAGGR